MEVTLVLSTIKMKFGQMLNVLYEKHFKHVFGLILETGN